MYVHAFFENEMTDNFLMLGVRIKFVNIGLQYNTSALGSKAK